MINFTEIQVMHLLFQNKDGMTSTQLAEYLQLTHDSLYELFVQMLKAKRVTQHKSNDEVRYIAHIDKKLYSAQIAMEIVNSEYDGDLVAYFRELSNIATPEQRASLSRLLYEGIDRR